MEMEKKFFLLHTKITHIPENFRVIIFFFSLFLEKSKQKISSCELTPRSAFCKNFRQGMDNAVIFVE